MTSALASSTLLFMPHAASALCRMLQTLEWDDPVLSEFPLAALARLPVANMQGSPAHYCRKDGSPARLCGQPKGAHPQISPHLARCRPTSAGCLHTRGSWLPGKACAPAELGCRAELLHPAVLLSGADQTIHLWQSHHLCKAMTSKRQGTTRLVQDGVNVPHKRTSWECSIAWGCAGPPQVVIKLCLHACSGVPVPRRPVQPGPGL